MTSQTEETTIDKSRLEVAKGLGIKGAHLIKDPAKLEAKIAEAESMQTETKVERKAPPKMKVFKAGEGTRKQQIARLEAEDPDATYMTQKAGITQDELAAKGLEVVKKSNGDRMYIGDDIVVRTDKNSYKEWQDSRTEYALNGMKSIDKDLDVGSGGKRIQAVTEQAKSGIESD